MGGTVVQPLFFAFPSDERLYDRQIVETHFLFGDTILVRPQLKEGHNRTYFNYQLTSGTASTRADSSTWISHHLTYRKSIEYKRES